MHKEFYQKMEILIKVWLLIVSDSGFP